MPSIHWEIGGGGSRLPVPLHTPKSLSAIRILSPVHGTWIHWVGGRENDSDSKSVGRSMPCFGSECFRCKSNLRSRWNGYASSLLYVEAPEPKWQTIVLSLNNSFHNALQAIDEWEKHILVFKVVQKPGKPNEYKVTTTERITAAFPHVEPFDVRVYLETMWGLRRPEPAKVATSDRGNHTIPFQRTG